MASNNIYRFLTQGFIVLLLVNVARLSAIGEDNHVRLSRGLGRIVNGTEATLEQFPHQVSLRRTVTMTHFCGGNIIDEGWILTAAHCMFYTSGTQRQPWEITIVAGDLWLNESLATHQEIIVSQIIIHEDYYGVVGGDDIALLKLSSNLVLTNSTTQAKTLQESSVAVDTNCQVAGWGTPDYFASSVTNELMYVDVPIVDKDRCTEMYVSLVNLTDGMICAGYTEGQKDACQGDSGGGLICNGKLTGLVSFGQGCAWPNYPGVYTNVMRYGDWVSEKIGNSGASAIEFSLLVKFALIAVIGLAYTS